MQNVVPYLPHHVAEYNYVHLIMHNFKQNLKFTDLDVTKCDYYIVTIGQSYFAMQDIYKVWCINF